MHASDNFHELNGGRTDEGATCILLVATLSARNAQRSCATVPDLTPDTVPGEWPGVAVGWDTPSHDAPLQYPLTPVDTTHSHTPFARLPGTRIAATWQAGTHHLVLCGNGTQLTIGFALLCLPLLPLAPLSRNSEPAAGAHMGLTWQLG